jgi:dTMP kinase
MSITLEELTKLIIEQAKAKGFGTKPEEINTYEKLALIHSEVSEALEAFRNNVYSGEDSFQEQLGDIVERTLHLAAIHNIDIGQAILKKQKNNKDRVWDKDAMNETFAPKRNKGKLIVIEGIDGSGKSTQKELLTKKLESKNLQVKSMHFPRHDQKFFGVVVDQYLNGEFGDAVNVNPYMASLLYACDRWEAKVQLDNWLESGDIVILDRYMSSNKGHQLSKLPLNKEGIKLLEWLDELEYEVFKIPRPDLVLYLQVPITEVVKMMSDRLSDDKGYIQGKFDHHESDTNHLAAAQKAYEFVADRYNYWEIIDCSTNGSFMPKEEIHEKIWTLLKDKGLLV